MEKSKPQMFQAFKWYNVRSTKIIYGVKFGTEVLTLLKRRPTFVFGNRFWKSKNSFQNSLKTLFYFFEMFWPFWQLLKKVDRLILSTLHVNRFTSVTVVSIKTLFKKLVKKIVTDRAGLIGLKVLLMQLLDQNRLFVWITEEVVKELFVNAIKLWRKILVSLRYVIII